MTSDPGAGRWPLPPIVIAAIGAAVVLAVAITVGLLTGNEPLPRCTPGTGVTCTTSSPAAS